MVHYHQHERWFVLREANVLDPEIAFVSLNWDNSLCNSDVVRKPDKTANLAHCLARVLFNLGLLTPEVEAALEVSITAHEKLGWAREYEELYGI